MSGEGNGPQPYSLTRKPSSASLPSPPRTSRSSSGMNRSEKPAARQTFRKSGAASVCRLGTAGGMRNPSGRVGGRQRRRELRADIAAEDCGPDVIKPAFEVRPDLAANVGPAFAEREI